ncbi:hypothetical protein GCM10009596_03550 [Arthrobacter rhombi]|uniref:DUF1990 family protein n=1 Tax=Arthrobacter rhombi TaxID=71253 RepID=UPI0031D5681D
MDVIAPLRDRLRLTFAGQTEGVPAWEDALDQGEDAGYFAPDSAVWRVHGGMTPIAAGIRALLLQALHPGALAGVAEHSNYREDPLGRLAGTIRWIFTLTYGDTTAADAACAHIRRLHVPVTGNYTDAHGEDRRYSANDPGLSEWVHIAFTDAFLRSHEIFRGPVPARLGGADAYVGQWAKAGELMGLIDPPRTEAALRTRMQEYDDGGHLAGGPRVDEVVTFLKDPPLDPLLLPGYRLLFAAVVDSLPARYRELLGLQTPAVPLPGGRSLRIPARLGGQATLAVAGIALERQLPSELAALRRLARIGQPADLTYAEHGLTKIGHAPAGYRTVHERVRVGTGEDAFRRLADGILGWDLHRGAGLHVPADTPRAAPGIRVVSGAGVGPVRLPVPCRVLWSEEPEGPGPRRSGFGYGTLKGHPEEGEESFVAVLNADGSVWFEVFAYSRHANALIRLGAPAAERMQALITRGYLSAATRLAAGQEAAR